MSGVGGTVGGVIKVFLKPLCWCGAPAVHTGPAGPECEWCAGLGTTTTQGAVATPAPPARQLGSGSMGLSIDVDDVSAVLLADGWHAVKFEGQNSSFSIAAYTYVQERPGELSDEEVHPRSPERQPGFGFQEASGEWVAGPLSSVLAVRYRL